MSHELCCTTGDMPWGLHLHIYCSSACAKADWASCHSLLCSGPPPQPDDPVKEQSSSSDGPVKDQSSSIEAADHAGTSG